MKYTTAMLIQQLQNGAFLKYCLFWGHRPRMDGTISKSCLSQWWPSPFIVENITYPTAEHWMMAAKARLFHDSEMLEKIIQSKHPHEAKKLGRKIRSFDAAIWDANKYQIVMEGNLHKFSQDEAMKTFLLNTNPRVIVEASPVDSIWGIGLAKDDPKAEHPANWKGENLLGFALMEVRDLLA